MRFQSLGDFLLSLCHFFLWKESKKVKPIVVDWGEVNYKTVFFMVEDKNKKVDSLHEYKISKERLAAILIAEDDGELGIRCDSGFYKFGKHYTEKE